MHWSIKKKPKRCYIDHKARVRQKDFIVFWSKNCGLEDSQRCREFNQNPNLWETKQIEKTHAKESNHTHKTIFTWFGNLPTSMELQEFHYKIRRYNSTQEHSQETQFPIHPMVRTRGTGPQLRAHIGGRTRRRRPNLWPYGWSILVIGLDIKQARTFID